MRTRSLSPRKKEQIVNFTTDGSAEAMSYNDMVLQRHKDAPDTCHWVFILKREVGHQLLKPPQR